MMATDGYHFFADELGAYHWDNPARHEASPHHHVKREDDAVIHGELDCRAGDAGAQYYDTLKAKRSWRGSSTSPTRITGS